MSLRGSRIGIGGVIVIAALAAGRAAAQPPPDCGTAAGSAEVMLARTNEARGTLGLPPYRVDATLTRIAFEHARDMAANGYYSHTGRDGRKEQERARDAGYGAGRAKVRVDEVFVARKHLDDGFAWLMSDPDHRPLMVHRDFVQVGSGAACTSFGHVWVMDFGTYQGVNDPTPAPTPVPPTATPEPPTATSTATPTETPVPTATDLPTAVPTTTVPATPGDTGAAGGAGTVGTPAGGGGATSPAATPTPSDGAPAGPGGGAGPLPGWVWWIGLAVLVVLAAAVILRRSRG